jgi:hypothetical protein
MTVSRRIFCLPVLAAAFLSTASAQSEGLPPEWEIKKSLQELATQVKTFKPLLDSLKPDVWAEKGASPNYAAQLKAAQNQMNYLVDATQRLSQQPDKMALGLETYFRYQSMETMLNSVTEAVRKYQNSAIADLLQAQLSESVPYREKLKQYVLALVTMKEQEFAVADREAQRCRETMSKQPAPAPVRKQDRK